MTTLVSFSTPGPAVNSPRASPVASVTPSATVIVPYCAHSLTGKSFPSSSWINVTDKQGTASIALCFIYSFKLGITTHYCAIPIRPPISRIHSRKSSILTTSCSRAHSEFSRQKRRRIQPYTYQVHPIILQIKVQTITKKKTFSLHSFTHLSAIALATAENVKHLKQPHFLISEQFSCFAHCRRWVYPNGG